MIDGQMEKKDEKLFQAFPIKKIRYDTPGLEFGIGVIYNHKRELNVRITFGAGINTSTLLINRRIKRRD